jgi:hypothetical protein
MNETQILFAIACAIGAYALVTRLLGERYRRFAAGVQTVFWYVACATAGGYLLGFWGVLLGLAGVWFVNAYREVYHPSH